MRKTGPAVAVREAVAGRSGGRCELCGELATQMHHRRPRAMGGSRLPETNSGTNLLHVCDSCHRFIESNRAEALAAGWLVPQGSDPARTAVLVGQRSWWTYLTEDGYAEAPPAEPAPATTPETARCACGHTVAEHQAVTRYSGSPGRSSRAKLRPKIKPTTSREHCTRCDCKGPR